MPSQRRSVHGYYQRQLTTTENNLNQSDARANHSRDVKKVRDIMANVSNRFVRDHGVRSALSIVDTHCHFDLIFDR